MTGGLFDPLGTDRGEPGRDGGLRGAARRSAPVAAAGAILAALAALVAVSWLRDTGDRGLPVAVAPIERLPPPPLIVSPPAPADAPASPAVDARPAAATPPPAAVPVLPPVMSVAPPRADQDVEVQNGVRIVRPHRAGPAPGGQTLLVPDTQAGR